MNVMQLMQMMRGGNPMQILMQQAQSNPQLGQVMQMCNGKTPDQMREMAQQLAQQRGVNLDQLAQQLGLKLPR